MTTTQDKRIFELHAELCKTLASAKRLEIISLLRNGEKQAKELAKEINISNANLSQHISLLRQRKIIAQRRDGINIFYRIADPKLLKACDFIRQILLGQLNEHNKLLNDCSKIDRPYIKEG